jgi:hypothetical protein
LPHSSNAIDVTATVADAVRAMMSGASGAV